MFMLTLKKQKETVKLLIEKGANVNSKTKNELTPLDYSTKYKHPELAALLRKHGGKTGEELKAKGK